MFKKYSLIFIGIFGFANLGFPQEKSIMDGWCTVHTTSISTSPVCGNINKGDSVLILNLKDKYCEVAHGGLRGWVYISFIKETPYLYKYKASKHIVIYAKQDSFEPTTGIYIGPRGGVYKLSPSGKKIYIKH